MTKYRSGGQILVDALRQHGTTHIFCVPGESYLPVLDALIDEQTISTVVCRHEGGAAMMADAYGKLTHRPGICFVTRGPGAANAVAGLHIAAQDSTPMILFVGQVPTNFIGREAFQEVDFKSMFDLLAKRVERVTDVKRIPEILSRAFHTANNGRAGPVVVELPEDVLRAQGVVDQVKPFVRVEASPGIEEMERFCHLLKNAKKPVVIVGGRGWSPRSRTIFQNFISAWNLPVAAAFRYQDVYDNTSRQYIGDVGIGINPKLKEAIISSDLLIAVCIRLGEITTSNYRIINAPTPCHPLVHIYPSIEELGSVYSADLYVNAGPNRFAEALEKLRPPVRYAWSSWSKELHDNYLSWTRPSKQTSRIHLGEIVKSLEKELGSKAVITNGAGNYTTWLHRYYRYSLPGSQLAPTSGSMGYGLPAAIVAKLLHPQCVSIALAGDGCFLMTSQELATAVKYDLSVTIIVVNNEMYGTIRMHQEINYPERISGTDLVNPDFCQLARAYGAYAERIDTTNQFLPALRRAIKFSGPSLIEIITDKEHITSSQTLSSIQSNIRKPD
ncbi:MAG: thiamine pyrophosphate-binding protein [Acidiferrobacteraceae bacterium]|nr:thiamine pyrophosphate-binding protein [Acidiferrobacteraceae bacterium]|tara:strand:+ start:651 stop:2321 length:1671 start_codon:yes stop_codon:yes gene_type:complete